MTSTGTADPSHTVEQSPEQQAFNNYMVIAKIFLRKIGHRMGPWLPIIDRNFINDPETRVFGADSRTTITIQSTCDACCQKFRCEMNRTSYFGIRAEISWNNVIDNPRSFAHVTSFTGEDLAKVEIGGKQTFEHSFKKDFVCSRFKTFA